MTDIVDRLRSPEVFLSTSGMVSPVAYEAAEEIGRLRAIVRINALRQGATHKEVDAVLYPVAQHD